MALLPTRIVVSQDLGGLESALKLFRAASHANVRAARRRSYFTPPAEARKIKARLARRRRKR